MSERHERVPYRNSEYWGYCSCGLAGSAESPLHSDILQNHFDEVAQRTPGPAPSNPASGRPNPISPNAEPAPSEPPKLILQGHANDPIWLMRDGANGEIGIRFDCGDAGVVYVSDSQAQNLVADLQKLLAASGQRVKGAEPPGEDGNESILRREVEESSAYLDELGIWRGHRLVQRIKEALESCGAKPTVEDEITASHLIGAIGIELKLERPFSLVQAFDAIQVLRETIAARNFELASLRQEIAALREQLATAKRFVDHAQDTADVMRECKADWIGGCATCLKLFDELKAALATQPEGDKRT
jgi:hypothetical protein